MAKIQTLEYGKQSRLRYLRVSIGLLFVAIISGLSWYHNDAIIRTVSEKY